MIDVSQVYIGLCNGLSLPDDRQKSKVKSQKLSKGKGQCTMQPNLIPTNLIPNT